MATSASRARRRRALNRLVKHHHIEFAELLADEARKDEARRQAAMAQLPKKFCTEDELHDGNSNSVALDSEIQRARLAEVKAIVAAAPKAVGL